MNVGSAHTSRTNTRQRRRRCPIFGRGASGAGLGATRSLPDPRKAAVSTVDQRQMHDNRRRSWNMCRKLCNKHIKSSQNSQSKRDFAVVVLLQCSAGGSFKHSCSAPPRNSYIHGGSFFYVALAQKSEKTCLSAPLQELLTRGRSALATTVGLATEPNSIVLRILQSRTMSAFLKMLTFAQARTGWMLKPSNTIAIRS